MKNSILNHFMALGCAALLAGCIHPRYTTIKEISPADDNTVAAMTAEQASETVKYMIQHPAAGKNTRYPDDRTLGKYTTSIRLRKHNRTGLVLVEVLEGSRVTMEFYVRTQEDGEKFANAVWRLRQEYRDK